MKATTALPCRLKDLLYVQGQTNFYAVNQRGEVAERVQTSGGLWWYCCRNCTAKFDSWQAVLGHIEVSGSNEEAAT
jgi:hypothetical protein